MAINEEQQYVTYSCDGVTTEFPVTFSYLKDEYLSVSHYDDTTGYTEDLDLGVGYTIVSDEVVTTSTYSSGDKIYIQLDVPVSQETTLLENGQISSDLLNFIHDKLTLLSGQLNTGIESAIRLAIPESSAVLTLPSERADTLLAFDEDGDAFVAKTIDQSITTVSTAMTPVVQALTLALAKAAMGINEVPAGGNAGQIIVKDSATDFDVSWRTGVLSTAATSFPASPAFAEECYRTDTLNWYKWNGTTWTQI